MRESRRPARIFSGATSAPGVLRAHADCHIVPSPCVDTGWPRLGDARPVLSRGFISTTRCGLSMIRPASVGGLEIRNDPGARAKPKLVKIHPGEMRHQSDLQPPGSASARRQSRVRTVGPIAPLQRVDSGGCTGPVTARSRASKRADARSEDGVAPERSRGILLAGSYLGDIHGSDIAVLEHTPRRPPPSARRTPPWGSCPTPPSRAKRSSRSWRSG